MPPDGQPADPFGELQAAAAQQMGLVLAWMEAGFTRTEAIYLLGIALAAQLRGPSS